MAEQTPSMDELYRQLPPELQQEVRDFVHYLLDTKVHRKQRYLRLSWAGGLSDLRDRYTSLELQKKALEWRGDN